MNAPAPLDALSPSVETLRHCDTPASSSNPELLGSWGYPTPGQSQTTQLLGQWDPTAMPRAWKLVQRTKQEEDLHWVQGSPVLPWGTLATSSPATRDGPRAPSAPRAPSQRTPVRSSHALQGNNWVAGMPQPLMPSVSDPLKQLPAPSSFRKASRMQQAPWSRNVLPALRTALLPRQPSRTSWGRSVSPQAALRAAATYGLMQLCGELWV